MRPVPAIPVDVVRIFAGALGFVWFAQILYESGDFANPNGLIDHRLVQDLIWYTRLGLFQPGISLAVLQLVFVGACALCVLVVVGYRPRLSAALLYLIAVSTFRWNFLVVYIDDAIMHLVFFWLILLPTGSTLTLGGWRHSRQAPWAQWKTQWVPGVAVRCFIVNVSLVYVVAGLWKWTSPMWREGTALYVALQMPISRAPDLWQPDLLPVLMLASFATLVLEPLIPAIFVLPTNHPLKWALLVAAVGFHVGIIVTMQIPYANAALVGALVLGFREEIMRALTRGVPVPAPPATMRRVGVSGTVAIGFVAVLAASMIGETSVSPWRSPTHVEPVPGTARTTVEERLGERQDGRKGFEQSGHNPLYAPLWAMGIAQSYRLFDWVDDRNWDIRHEVRVWLDGKARTEPANELFPGSTHNILLQSYMHGITWGRVDGWRAHELRASLMTRYARRYCDNERTRGTVEVYALFRRITKETSETRRWSRELLMRFQCQGSEPAFSYPAIGES